MAERQNAASAVNEELPRCHEPSAVNARAIVYCCSACALSDLNFSMLVPFFPRVAAARGCSTTTVGILFALMSISSLVVSPLAPSMCRMFGGARVLRLSLLWQSALAFAFAFADRMATRSLFVAACAMLRLGQGIGCALSEVSGTGLLMRSVEGDRIGHAIGWSEAARGVGIMFGPLVGGGLDSQLGYWAPFAFSSTALLLLALSMMLTPPAMESSRSHPRRAAHQGMVIKPVRQLLRSPIVLTSLLTCFMLMAAIAFLQPTIQPFMAEKPYSLDEVQVGLVYSSSLLTYTILSACAGPLASRIGNAVALTAGLVLMALSYLTLAPVPGPFNLARLSLLPFLEVVTPAEALALAISSLCGMGLGGALAFVPANSLMVAEGESLGLSVEESSDPIAALSMAAFTAGAAVGPLVGGVLVDWYGFRPACAIAGLFLLGNAVVVFVVVCGTRHGRRRKHREGLHSRTSTMDEALLHGGTLVVNETVQQPSASQ